MADNFVRKVRSTNQLQEFGLQPKSRFVGPDNKLYEIVAINTMQNPELEPRILNRAVLDRDARIAAALRGEDAFTSFVDPNEPFELQALKRGFQIKPANTAPRK